MTFPFRKLTQVTICTFVFTSLYRMGTIWRWEIVGRRSAKREGKGGVIWSKYFKHICENKTISPIKISSFSFPVLFIWVFSLFPLVSLAEGLSILLILLKSQHFVSLILCVVLLASVSLISCLIFIISSIHFFWVWLAVVFLRAWSAALPSLFEISVIL
jgi:hypothetical protein